MGGTFDLVLELIGVSKSRNFSFLEAEVVLFGRITMCHTTLVCICVCVCVCVCVRVWHCVCVCVCVFVGVCVG